jgi:DNA polymerase-3 subunit delta
MAPNTAKDQKQNEHVFVVAGDNPSLVNAKYIELIDRLIPHEERDTGLLVVDADKAIIGEVLDELRTLPFLTKKRVVALRNADKFISGHGEEEEQDKRDKQDKHGGATNREILEKYFDNPCPTGVLVMTVSKWASNTKLAKKLPKIGTLITVESPKGKEIRQRLITYAQDTHNKRLDYGTADLLVDIAGDDITRLYTEVDKLATYATDDKSITIAHIEAIVGRNRLFDAFKVIDACLQRNAAEAVERLRKMFADDKSAEFTTLGAFAYHFRRMFNVKKMMQEGMNEYQVSKKIWLGYNKDAQFALLRRLTQKQIGDQLLQLAETDYAIKRGQVQPRIAIEQLVLRLATL